MNPLPVSAFHSPFAAGWRAHQRAGAAPVLPRCTDCGRWVYPIQPFCPACLDENLAWHETAGRALILSVVPLWRGMAPDAGFAPGWTVGLARLVEGVPAWVHLGRIAAREREGEWLVQSALDRRGRLVLIAARAPAALHALAQAIGNSRAD